MTGDADLRASRKDMILALAYAGAQTLSKEDRRAREIIARSPVRIFSASYSDWWECPYRLQMVQRADQKFRDMSYQYIIDSGYRDDSVTNEAIIEKAVDLNPDWIVPKDYPGNPERTAESLREFADLYDDRGDKFGGRPLIPVQPPHAQTVERFPVYGEWSNFAVGGLHYFSSPEAQVDALKEFEEVANPAHLHALGVGTNLEFVTALRDEPSLVDSLDISTPETAVKNNGIPDRTWIQREFEIPTGVNSTMLRGQLSRYIHLQLSYMLSDLCDQSNFPGLGEQAAISEFGDDEEDTLNIANPPREPGRAHGHQPA
jgi:hypothetical protein